MTTTNAIKNFTLKIILKITGTLFQSLLSLIACIVYVIGTYYMPDADDKSTQIGQMFFI